MPKKPSDTVREAADDFFSRRPQGKGFVVALSGGSDSVALLRYAVSKFWKERITGAHFDHCLRGAESDADAEFCKNLCESLGVPFVMEKRDVGEFATQEKTGTEDAARRLRYDFLMRVSDERGYAAILTGHTADDQTETVLANFFRGSKLRGLSGIPKENGRILRPFLELKKDELLAYLDELGQNYRTDSSNADPAYLRNRIRNRIIPEIETFNPGISSTVSRFAQYALELDEYLADEVFAYLGSQKEPKTLEIADFAQLTTFFKKEVLSRLYTEANEGGIGLSEGMVSEMLRFCSADFWGKSKTFWSLELERRKGRISYKKIRKP